MKTEHTPGPWMAEGPYIVGSEGETIAEVYSGVDGDPRLIAAAPEMLEVIKEILTIPEVKYQRSFEDWIAVIEKATGKTWAELQEPEILPVEKIRGILGGSGKEAGE